MVRSDSQIDKPQHGCPKRARAARYKYKHRHTKHILRLSNAPTPLKGCMCSLSSLCLLSNEKEKTLALKVNCVNTWKYALEASKCYMQNRQKSFHQIVPLCVISSLEILEVWWPRLLKVKVVFIENIISDAKDWSKVLNSCWTFYWWWSRNTIWVSITVDL